MKKTLFALLTSIFVLNSCVEERKVERSGEDLGKEVENVEIVEKYDTTRMVNLYMKVVGKENFIQANYVDGMTNEDISANSLYENLVYVEVLGSLYADESEEGYVEDETGTLLSKTAVYDMIHLEMDDVQQPFRVSVITKMEDFASWKQAFDEEELNRQNAGMKHLQIGVNIEDPQEVFVLLAIDDIAKTREMMEHHGLRKKMKDAGVIGDPKVKFWRPAGPQSEEL